MSLTMSREHITYHSQPQITGYTGRRLVLAPRSFDRIVGLQPRWWQDEKALKTSRWNTDTFTQLLDATLAPDSVFIADLSQRRGETYVVDMHMSTLWKLDGFEEMLEALSGRIGSLCLHTGYNVRTDTTWSLDWHFGDGPAVHLVAGGVWHDLFQVSWDKYGSMPSDWSTAMMTIAGLPERTHGLNRMDLLVDFDFKCPYDEIVEVKEHWSGQEEPWFTTYATVCTED